MKKWTVIVDCDDVLFDCNGPAIERLNRETGKEFSKNDVTRWGRTDSVLDRRLKYFTSPEFVKELPLFPGARGFIKNLSQRAAIVFASSVPEPCAQARIAAIRSSFPEAADAEIIIAEQKDQISGDFMLDDCPDHIRRTAASYPVLFRQPWNRTICGCLSVESYQQFLDLFDDITECRVF